MRKGTEKADKLYIDKVTAVGTEGSGDPPRNHVESPHLRTERLGIIHQLPGPIGGRLPKGNELSGTPLFVWRVGSEQEKALRQRRRGCRCWRRESVRREAEGCWKPSSPAAAGGLT